jgi:radical SAM superfamily enzyme YgiQ (UPF0313 family)
MQNKMINLQKPAIVGLVQINNSFSGQNYLPYSVGLLQSYADRNLSNPGNFEFKLPIYKRLGVSQAVDQLADADIVGFSTYVWNGRISLEIARRLKARNPGVLVMFGGPHVPDHPEQFLRANPFIDIAVHNEGEQTFVKILDRYPSRDWADIPGVSYLDPAGTFIRLPNAPRLNNLDRIPSPFLEGAFDALIAANPTETWIGLWETNRGCPFQCTFCDWGSATAGKVSKFGLERLYGEVDWFARNKIEYIFCCDANFGIQKRDVDIANYVADVKRNTGYPVALSVQNTKNATERAYLTQKILSDSGLNKGVALSMQSIDMSTLINIKRQNISLDTYMELQRRFTKDRVETYSDLILGLPGETYDSFTDGVNRLIENGQHNRIQFNNLAILPNAEMGDPVYQAKYGMETIETKIINIHGERIERDDDVAEVQDLVIATASMPRAEWARTRAFCWMTALLHFDKLFQIPLMVSNQHTGLSYRSMIEAFMQVGPSSPTLAGIRDLFLQEAAGIQQGGAEYTYSAEWLGIYWPADEYVFIKLTAENRFDQFYHEAGAVLAQVLAENGHQLAPDLLTDALQLNRALIKQPGRLNNLSLNLNYDLMSFYTAVRNGEPATLHHKPTTVEINRAEKPYEDFQAWCREVVWWGNKKGAYLYTNRSFERELAGHY